MTQLISPLASLTIDQSEKKFESSKKFRASAVRGRGVNKNFGEEKYKKKKKNKIKFMRNPKSVLDISTAL